MSGASYGNWLRATRTGIGMSQETLAGLIGGDRSYINKIERGVIRTPTLETRKKIAGAIGVEFGDGGVSYEDSSDMAMRPTTEQVIATLIHEINPNLSGYVLRAVSRDLVFQLRSHGYDIVDLAPDILVVSEETGS